MKNDYHIGEGLFMGTIFTIVVAIIVALVAFDNPLYEWDDEPPRNNAPSRVKHESSGAEEPESILVIEQSGRCDPNPVEPPSEKKVGRRKFQRILGVLINTEGQLNASTDTQVGNEKNRTSVPNNNSSST
jgi:hypothetical protein